MKRAIICDLDGTLYNADARRDRCFTAEKKDFDRWNREAHTDAPHVWCAEIIHAMRHTGVFPVFVSGRDDTYKPETERWLKEHLNLQWEDYLLFMRPKGDYRKDTDLKREIYAREIAGRLDVRFCIDDRRQVVEMWRELGLTCLQCAEGDF